MVAVSNHRKSAKAKLSLAVLSLFLVAGCAGLTVESQMSSSVFLEPVAPEKRVVYVKIRSTADRKGIDLDAAIRAGVREAGYRITDNPDKANFLLQANVLKIGEFDPDQLRNYLSEGPTSFGATAAGVFAGLAVADSIGSDLGGVAAGVAVGVVAAAVVEGIANLLYDERLYAIVTDIELAQRVGGGVSTERTSRLTQGDQSTERQYSSGKSKWQKYRTRVLSSARAVNTPWEVVAVELKDGLSNSIAGMF